MNTNQAIFAGGCFWCTASAFDEVPGVLEAKAGYIGGQVENPTYEQVCQGDTGHLEALQLSFDPEKITYAELLDIFWRSIDPSDPTGQFADRGPQYRTAIFVFDEEQKSIALASKQQIEQKLAHPVATTILPATTFYSAENYHQDYHRKNPVSYEHYVVGSGRSRRLLEIQQILDHK
jgi:peptide methionine sulfoxide reductase msrA/msrB